MGNILALLKILSCILHLTVVQNVESCFLIITILKDMSLPVTLQPEKYTVMASSNFLNHYLSVLSSTVYPSHPK